MGVHLGRLAGRAAALGMAVALTAGVVATPPAARAVGTEPSTTTLSPVLVNPKPQGRTTDLVATVAPATTGSVTFYDGAAPVATVDLDGSGTATYTLPADMPDGEHAMRAEFAGNDTYAPSTSPVQVVKVGPRPTTTEIQLSNPRDPTGATAQKGDVVTAMVKVYDAGDYMPSTFPMVGTVEIRVDGSLVASIDPWSGTDLPTAAWALGTRTVSAEFVPGSADYAGSNASAGVSILANVVEAVGYTPSPSTFYPYRDGYKDTTAIRGRRYETASVTAKVYSPTGKLVRTLAVPSGTGAWSVAWNGRNTAGTMVAAGKYKVRQTVRDALGATKVLPAVYVNVSAKRIYTKTITLKQSTGQKDAGSLSSGWLGWKFTLPSAAVYKKLVFGVYGVTGVPLGLFGPHDYTYCPSTTRWDWYDCMAPYQTFPTSASWKNVTGSTTRNRHGTAVKLYAVGGGRTKVAYARVVVTYGVLK